MDVTVSLVDRRDRVGRGVVSCPRCWEPVTLKTGTWTHVRTGDAACSPVCDVCQSAPGTIVVGRREFDGASTRFVARNFVCEHCRPRLGAVETFT